MNRGLYLLIVWITLQLGTAKADENHRGCFLTNSPVAVTIFDQRKDHFISLNFKNATTKRVADDRWITRIPSGNKGIIFGYQGQFPMVPINWTNEIINYPKTGTLYQLTLQSPKQQTEIKSLTITIQENGQTVGVSQPQDFEIEKDYSDCTHPRGLFAPGNFKDGSPILGSKMDMFNHFVSFAKKHHSIVRFANAIRFNTLDLCPTLEPTLDTRVSKNQNFHTEMVPEKYRDELIGISKQQMNDFLKDYGQSSDQYLYTELTRSPGHAFYSYSSGTYIVGLRKEGFSEAGNNGQQYFNAFETVLIHELQHAERFSLQWNENKIKAHRFYDDEERDRLEWKAFRQYSEHYEAVLDEVGPTVHQIVNNDLAMRQILHLPEMDEYDYHMQIPVQFEKSLTIGHLAKFFATSLKTYHSVEEVLMSDEGQKFLSQYYSDEKCKPLSSLYIF